MTCTSYLVLTVFSEEKPWMWGHPYCLVFTLLINFWLCTICLHDTCLYLVLPSIFYTTQSLTTNLAVIYHVGPFRSYSLLLITFLVFSESLVRYFDSPFSKVPSPIVHVSGIQPTYGTDKFILPVSLYSSLLKSLPSSFPPLSRSRLMYPKDRDFFLKP